MGNLIGLIRLVLANQVLIMRGISTIATVLAAQPGVDKRAPSEVANRLAARASTIDDVLKEMKKDVDPN